MKRIRLKYYINGAIFRRSYPATPEGIAAATDKAADLLHNGITVVWKASGKPAWKPILVKGGSEA